MERYISQDFFRLEYERLWPRVWQWACNKEDIPNVGDHIVYDIGAKSVLVVRSAADQIRAYYNACLGENNLLADKFTPTSPIDGVYLVRPW